MGPTTPWRPTFHLNRIDFSRGTDVVSIKQEFILPVRGLGKRRLVTADGSPIKTTFGKVVGDGGAVIAKPVSHVQAAQIHGFLNGNKPDGTLDIGGIPKTLEQWQRYVSFLREQLGITDIKGVENIADVVNRSHLVISSFGFHYGANMFGFMTSRYDVAKALYFSGPAHFAGRQGIEFFPKGFVVVRPYDDSNAPAMTVYDFGEKYMHASGARTIYVRDLPHLVFNDDSDRKYDVKPLGWLA